MPGAPSPPPSRPGERPLQAKAAKQLSPALLAMLLEDLVEYNGINFRTVPLRTFREKYIGLYFGLAVSPRCRRFLQALKAFYVVMNHKFECVLVDTSATEEEYKQHVQMTLWPTYPQGDYRALLLRKHFEVDEVPQLVVLDPNGMVVTCNGVARVEADQMALTFPWCERVVENVWGDRMQGQMGNILEDLDLPAVSGLEAAEHEIIGLLFGELWCPETRDLLKRLKHLKSCVLERVDPGGEKGWTEESFVFYFVHTESLDKYQRFPDYDMPFETHHLADEDQKEALFHFMGISDVPSFAIVCPEEGWVLKDGDTWLRRDPTGILFPWKSQLAVGDLMDDENDGDEVANVPNIIRPLNEDDLNAALCQGPVFVAFLHKVRARRAEALSMVRAAILSFAMQPMDEVEKQEAKAKRSTLLTHDGCDVSGEYVEGEGRATLTRPLQHWSFRRHKSVQRAHTGENMESNRRDSNRLLLEPERVLWRASQKFGERNDLLHGTAPWNAKGEIALHREAGMSFFYSIADDRATHMLSRFCCHDAKLLRQHQIWLETHQIHGADAERALQEMRDRLTQFSEMATSTPTPSGEPPIGRQRVAGTLSPGGGLRGGNLAGNVGVGGSSAPMMSFMAPGSSTQNSGEATAGCMSPQNVEGDDKMEGNKLDADRKGTDFQPRTRFHQWGDMTEELLGDGHKTHGTALLIDLPRGCYYVCGRLTDQDTVHRFLDGWSQGVLDPFEISLLNTEELVRDEEQEVARQLAAGTHGKFGPGDLTDVMPSPMPGIVIWIPTKQHAESGESPNALYKALLHFAVRRCPRVDDSALWPLQGVAAARDDFESLPKGGAERLWPWIEKMWIFGLADGEEAASEEGFGTWEPPPESFMRELHVFVQRLAKKQAMEEIRELRGKGNQGSLLVPTSPNGSDRGGSSQRPSRRGSLGSGRGSLDTEEGVIPRRNLFDEGLRNLRMQGSEEKYSMIGNYNICMRTAKTRRELYNLMLDELGYHTNMQCPPPPLFVLLAGDMPPDGAVPWPSTLQMAHVHVVGHAPDQGMIREISPATQTLDWERWLRNSVDPHIHPVVAKHIDVPWG